MINLNKVSFSYKRGKEVLSDVSLDIQPGSVCGLLGRNGEGKTTLLNLISGLLFPKSGICDVNGFVPKKRETQFLSSLFFLPEEPLLPNIKVGTYLDAYAPFYPNYKKNIEAEVLADFELDRSMNLGRISLGQKKKVAISLALAVDTPILLMDEPTNGLDIPSKSIFRRLLSSKVTEERVIVISTHQVRELEQLIDEVMILDSNRVILHKSIADIESKLFFGKPIDHCKPIYSETTVLGEYALSENVNGVESNVSLELLFNGLMKNPTPILSLLK